MDPRSAGRRDLALLATAAVGLTRFADGPWLWVAAVLLLAGVALGALQVLGEGEPRGVPIESLVLPAVATAAAVGAIRLLPLGLATIIGLVITFVVVSRTLALEARLEALSTPPREEDRTRVLAWAVIVAFTAFSGIAATIPGGLVEPGQSGLGQGGSLLVGQDLLLLVVADAVVAFMLGYRVSALRLTSVRDATMSALTYGIVVAIAAGGLRVLAVPRLLGPALLTLVFFLWDALHGTAPGRRRDPRWLWEMGLLIALGVLVVALNVRLTG